MNKLIIITAPSGAGKTTIVKHLISSFDHLSFSVSATTRAKRDHEKEGEDYYYLTVDAFKEKIEQDAFLEWVEVYEGQFYGTLKSEVNRIFDAGKSVIFDIDVRGATMLKKSFPKNSMSIFIKPPSFEVLKNRLINRQTESKNSLDKRLKRVREELTYEKNFDLTVINDNLDISLAQVEKLVQRFLHN